MTAKGKGRVNASSLAKAVAAGEQPAILVESDGKGHAWATNRKTGVCEAKVTAVALVNHDDNGRPTRTARYALTTEVGEVIAVGIQTFWRADAVKWAGKWNGNQYKTETLLGGAKTEESDDMTVTVKKGAGRAAGAARTSRAAQRTALPPKGSKATPADAEKATRKRRAAVTGSEESPTPRRRTRTQPEIVVDPAPRRKSSPKRAKAGATKSSTIPAGFPGSAKAQALVDHATANGWTAKLVETDGGENLKVELGRDEETITASWINGSVTPQNLPTYTVAGERTVKLRNVSAARKLIDGSRVDVKKVPDRGAGKPRAARPGGAGPRSSRKGQVADGSKRGNVPFDLESAEDGDIVSALRGRAIFWRNRISQAAEDAVVSATGPVRIERNQKGERAVTFNDPRGGARSVNLNYLLNVK